MRRRPTFQAAWAHFKKIYGSGDIVSVGNLVGGKVKQNIDLGIKEPLLGFTNACAIRMSYTLNKSGIIIDRGEWKTVSGEKKNWYIYRVRDLLKYLKFMFGKPDKTIKTPKAKDFKGMKGILVFTVNWRDASGHVTLWNGSTCSDTCYFPAASEASIWILK